MFGPVKLRVYLKRKISKFRKSGEVGGPNFGLPLKKKFFLKVDGIQICLMQYEQSSTALVYNRFGN